MQLRTPPADVRSFSELKSWLLNWFGSMDDRELVVGFMTLYIMWLARNDAREKPCIEDPKVTARKSLALLDEWSLVNGTNRAVTMPAATH